MLNVEPVQDIAELAHNNRHLFQTLMKKGGFTQASFTQSVQAQEDGGPSTPVLLFRGVPPTGVDERIAGLKLLTEARPIWNSIAAQVTQGNVA